MPLARRLAGSVLNLPFQGWLLPLKQRVNEWQLFPSPRVRFLVTLHEFTTRISMLLCLSRGSCDIFSVSLPAFWNG